MLLKNFYTIEDLQIVGNDLNAKLSLNPNHIVYDGHFPEQPVVPGVIQLQIIREITENGIGKKLLIKAVSQAKYLIPIIPVKEDIIEINIMLKQFEGDSIKSTSQIISNGNVHSKIRIEFEKISN